MNNENKSFYYGENGKIKINDYLFRRFLSDEGFGQYQSTTNRLSKKQIFRNVDGVLELQDANSVKQWMRKYFESIPDADFKKERMWSLNDGNETDKFRVLSVLQMIPVSKIESVLTQLDVHSSIGYKDSSKINLFNDSSGIAHIRFQNGVVRVTKDGITLIEYSSLKNEGAVWESSIIPRDIQIDESKGLYEKFCEKAMSYHNPDKKSENWTDNYDLNEKQYLAMRTGFGYLLHTFNSPSVPKCVYFIDSDSELGKPQGGNGKSFVMKSIKFFKSTVMIDGKVFRKSMDSGGQFQFSMVQPDTTLCVIDDIRPEFDFDMLFSKITGDMQIEQKGKDILIIPEKDKPKFGVTTNYVIAGVGTSYKRRQHIVEFGNYWSHCNDIEEKPSDEKHLGKELFSNEFQDEDWNQFYTYGFKCIQEYFNIGLKESEHQTYLSKTIKIEIEGSNGDGTITDWIDKWCKEDRVKNDYHIDGLPEKDLYQNFIVQNPEVDPYVWDMKKFRQSFFNFCDLTPEYDYNPQKSSRGKSLTDRRWQKGSAGKQENWIKIVDIGTPKEETQKDSKEKFFDSIKSEEKVKKSEVISDPKDNDIDATSYFEKAFNGDSERFTNLKNN